MKIYVIVRIGKEKGESILPFSNVYPEGFIIKENAEYIMREVMETEVIALNEDGPEENGWYYGITFDNWVAKFDDNDNPVEYITKYSLEEVEVNNARS